MGDNTTRKKTLLSANETRSQSRCPIIFSFMDGLVGAGAAVCAFCFEWQGRR